MRWLAIPIVAVLGWLAFTLTPLAALYDLARAVRARDVAYVESHVNYRTLRLSLSRQITAAVRAALDADTGLEPRERQRLGDAAAGVSLALAERMVTPQTVIDLLDDGWPESLDLRKPQDQEFRGLSIEGASRLLPFYTACEMRGFRTVVIPVPPSAPREQQFRLRMRLRGFSWRLIDVEITEALRAQMAQSLSRGLVRAGVGERAPALRP